MKVPLLDLKAQYASVRDEIQKVLLSVAESQYFILGPEVKALEEEIKAYCASPFAMGVASGSDALLLALMALEVGPGDEIITTPYTFFATVGAIARLGATAVFVDIDPGTYNMNPSRLEERITGKTRAIIPVHLYGQCADMDPILELAGTRGLAVIEDAAQAIGSTYCPDNAPSPRQAGTMGEFGFLSFFPSKNLGGFGDGGMVLARDENPAHMVRILRVHGGEPKYYHKVVGCNSRLDALQAAVLRVKLRYLDGWSEGRRRNADIYRDLFQAAGLTDRIVLPFTEYQNTHIYNQFVIRVPKRDELRKYLQEKEVGTEIYYPVPLHLQECFRFLGCRRGDFPEAEKAAAETLALPIYPELTREQQEYVVQCIADFFRN